MEKGSKMTSGNAPGAMADGYDREAEASGWFGPEVAFGLSFKFISRGESLLDLGIGSGLGSYLFRRAGLDVYGLDASEAMLDVCRGKGLSRLVQHDLRDIPWPYAGESMDNVLCTGVFNFFQDLSPLIRETRRILRRGGLFIFAVGDRGEDQTGSFSVGREHTGSDLSLTMYRHSPRQVGNWLDSCGLRTIRDLAFTVYMDRERTHSRQARVYVARKADEQK